MNVITDKIYNINGFMYSQEELGIIQVGYKDQKIGIRTYHYEHWYPIKESMDLTFDADGLNQKKWIIKQIQLLLPQIIKDFKIFVPYRRPDKVKQKIGAVKYKRIN